MRNEELLFKKLLQITDLLDKSLTKQCCETKNQDTIVSLLTDMKAQNEDIKLLLTEIKTNTTPV